MRWNGQTPIHTHPSTGRRVPRPSILRIGRPRWRRRLSIFSWVPLRRPLSSLSTTHPPQKTPQPPPPSFSSQSPPPPPSPPRYIPAAANADGRKAAAAAPVARSLPPSHLRTPIVSDRGCLPAEDADRARNGAGFPREAVCSFVPLAATVSSGFHHLSNDKSVLYLRIAFFKLYRITFSG